MNSTTSEMKGPAAPARALATARVGGFTLIEMLVVLLIMGLLVGLVSASARPDDRALLRLEADRLAQLLDLAATESRLTGRPIAWTATGPAYRFWQFSEDLGWKAIADEVLRPRTLPNGMTIAAMRSENGRSTGPMRVEFSPYGAAASFSIDMALGKVHSTVASSPIGDVRVLPEGGADHEKMGRR